ncbi:MAG: DNA replication/repair protein RecF [Propionibacteriaceae bacterium]|nr:DNA replication/repair protein RecF [Propionibacteriaceae bacterium]
MYLSTFTLSDYRSYERLDLEFSPGTTVLLGSNGFGKTNLVEAINYLSTLNSHRVGHDQPLVRFGCESATISARVHAGHGDDRCLSIAVEIQQRGANKAVLGGSQVRPKEILGAVRTVLFSPEDLDIVQGEPASRRRFLDDLLVGRWPRLAATRAEYERTVKQKTTLLKALSGRSVRQAGTDAGQSLEAWNDILIHHGGELLAARLRTLGDIESMVSDHYRRIAPKSSPACLAYHSTVCDPTRDVDVESLKEKMQEVMERRKDDELTRGMCLVGPHRDDVGLYLGEMPVRGYASHGESWSYGLALKLASLDLLRDDGIEPILILDDVFAELDSHRRAEVVQAIESTEQAFVTVAVREDIPTTLSGSLLHVTPGAVSVSEVS